MKHLIIVMALLVSSVGNGKELPLMDFFKKTEFSRMVISPEGDRVAGVFENENSSDAVTVLDVASMKKLSTFEFGTNRRVSRLSWANNDHIVFGVEKRVGNLDRKGKYEGLYMASFDGKKREFIYKGDTTSGMSAGRLRNSLPKDDKYILVDIFASGGGFGIKKHNIKSGKAKKIQTPKPHFNQFMRGVFLDKNHNPRIVLEGNEKLDIFMYYLPSGEKDWRLLPGVSPTNLTVLGYDKNDDIMYLSSDHGGSEAALYEMNLATGKLTEMFKHDYVDIEGGVVNLDNELVGFTMMPGYVETGWVKPSDQYAKLWMSLQKSFPNDAVSITSATNDGSKAIVAVRSDVNPGVFYLYDTQKNEIQYLASTRSWLKADQMAEMKPVSLKARDGLELHGYLTLPRGVDPKNLPLVVNPHGGPHGPRDRWGFNPEVQFLANRGYAVLQINFRGSGGYGIDFRETGYKKWGREMQDDVTDATLWAVEQGYANKDRICIYGGSYGGYASLQAVVREPDLYQCAIGYVGVYDLTLFNKCGDIPKTQIGKNTVKLFVGEDESYLHEVSPSFNVDKIKADLFIAHGSDDVRVPMCQWKSLKKSLDDAGKDYIEMVKDEGHGYQEPENIELFYSTMEEFLDKHIGQ